MRTTRNGVGLLFLCLAAAGCTSESDGKAAGAAPDTTVDSGGTTQDGAGGASTRDGSGGTGGTVAGSGGAGGTGGAGAAGSGGSTARDAQTETTTAGSGIAAKHPGDIGIENDPDVIWAENFEEGTVAQVLARYDDKKNEPGMTLEADVPQASSGHASLKLTAGGGTDATDFFKEFPAGYDEMYVRYYAKYQAGVTWHHTSVWIGGYNPATAYPNPQAGLKPNGDDRIAVALEPIGADGLTANPRMDFYNYWMKMRSWMDQPMGNTAYYGNSTVHRANMVVDDGQWMCIELHVKLNSDPSSATGGALGVWKNGVLIQAFDETAPVGCWIKDKFCPEGADGTECTDYPNLCAKPYVPLDLQWRSTAALKLNYFWPQNYVTDGPAGDVSYDDMVVAKSYIGCVAGPSPGTN